MMLTSTVWQNYCKMFPHSLYFCSMRCFPFLIKLRNSAEQMPVLSIFQMFSGKTQLKQPSSWPVLWGTYLGTFIRIFSSTSMAPCLRLSHLILGIACCKFAKNWYQPRCHDDMLSFWVFIFPERIYDWWCHHAFWLLDKMLM